MFEKFINWLIEVLANFIFWLDDLITDEDDYVLIFDPNSGYYPTHLGSDYTPVGYVKVKRDCFLWTPNKNKVLEIYENSEWANNTLGRRIQPKEGRILAVFAHGTEYRYDKPRPNIYDGGAVGYVVMKEQTPIDGKDLMQFIDDGNLAFVIRYEDVATAWMPELEE